MYYFTPMHIFILILSAVSVARADIIDLAAYRQARGQRCESALARAPGERQAEVLAFSVAQPTYVPTDTFLAEMAQNSGWVYFYFSDGNPPFGLRDEGRWNTEPPFPIEQDLYVLKTYRPLTSPQVPAHRQWSLRELRLQYRPVSFTRLRISPLFKLTFRAIEHFRAMHSYMDGTIYHAPHFDFALLLAGQPIASCLARFVSSWPAISREEQSFQSLLLHVITQSVRRNQPEPDTRAFARDLQRTLAPYYPADFLQSLNFHMLSPDDRLRDY